MRQGRSIGFGPALFHRGVAKRLRHGTLTPASLVRFQPSLPIVGANSGSFAPPHAAGLIPSVAPPPQTEILISVWSRAKGVGPYVPVFISYDPLAQLVEHLPFKPVVRGSSPRRVTMKDGAEHSFLSGNVVRTNHNTLPPTTGGSVLFCHHLPCILLLIPVMIGEREGS